MSTPGPHDRDEGTAPKSQSVTACMCITGSLGIFRSEKGEVAGMIQWDCPRSFHYNYFCPPLNSSPKVMDSTGMNPAPTGGASRTRCHDDESAAIYDGQVTIPRPTPAEFRKLASGPEKKIINAMKTTRRAFNCFKKVLRDQALMILDCERFLHEQIPDIWAIYLDWAHKKLAPFLSKYANAWPVELYIERYLSKNTYSKRYAFRIQMTRLRLAPKTVRIESAASERDMSASPVRVESAASERDMSISPAPVGHVSGHVSASPAPLGPPPSYEEHDFAHPDSDIASFLKAVNPDLSRLVPAFEELGIWNEEDLIEERFFRERIDGEDE
ncbi:hypothetical protein EV702DRAFT_1202747 [Suillus placidus]|uniref:Uncharacterized protein n=1 Tax=Suillus placidus TaxID=48579 RepID=A0A9P6ZKU2_9AGAM|nr:hypothetical protein EV702DRAFT_1202747 [Suillus placidus]